MDFNKPAIGDTYSNFAQAIRDNDAAIAKQFNTSLGISASNMPAGVVVWDDSAKNWKVWNGSNHDTQLATTYGIDISGNAGTASAIPWSGVTSKPTTISGYGITDGVGATQIQNQTLTYFTTTGSSTNYVVTASPVVGSYVNGLRLRVKFHVGAGTFPTLNVNGLGDIGLYYRNYDGVAVACVAQHIPIGHISDVEYTDGTFIVINACHVPPLYIVTSQITTVTAGNYYCNSIAPLFTIGYSPTITGVSSYSANTVITTIATMTEFFNCRVLIAGTYRVSFTLGCVGGNPSTTVTGRIYKNGSAFGTNRSFVVGFGGSTTNTYTEDLGFAAGDTVQLFASSGGGQVTSIYIQNFKFGVSSSYNCLIPPSTLVIGDR